MYIVIGETGKGKSTFINCVAGKEIALVKEGLESTTNEAEVFETDNYFLVDTPGFNDTRHDDNKSILKQLLNLFLMR